MAHGEEDTRTDPREYVHKDEEEAEVDHLAPARWWFSSTLFPLIAGTFGPVAIAFNICALVMDWRVIVDPSSTESTGIDVRDPDWLDAINAISLFFSVLANLLLLAHMTGRLSFHLAQPATIISFFLASFLLIGLVAAAPARLQLPAGEARTFSQAYYYAILAAALEFIIGSMMIITATGVYIGRYSREFKLSMSQRTLMFQTTTFIGYILCAGAVYSRVEGWDFLDSVYFVDVTLLTIGYGDFAPKTHLGRSLLFPAAVGGILFLGLIIASIRTLALEGSAKKVSIRTVEKARELALKRLDPGNGTISLGRFHKRDIGKNVSTELGRREQEFNIMREVQKKAASDNRWTALAVSAFAAFFLWFVGAAVFQQAELNTQGWSYFEALYFTYVSLLTIGYGDYYPQTNSGKPAFVMWSLIALPTLTVLIGAIGDSISEYVGKATLWIADRLPEKSGALKALKGEANKTKKGDGGGFQEAKPPGFMSNGPNGGDKSGDAEVADGGDSKGQIDLDKASKHYRQYLIMREMKNVVQHLDATPPRQYSYAEWTWILKLIGQDESNPNHHRRVGSVQATENAGLINGSAQAGEPEADGKVKPWSWLGQGSPLMSGIDEPKWVLDRLMDTLERELKAQGDARSDKSTRVGLEELNER